jgi:signal transduction histidine kinase
MAELHPSMLAEMGLAEALRIYASDFRERTGIDCTVRSEALPELDPSRETVLYRVAQEALTNVAKHADASRVEVALRVDAEVVELTILDDGRGFDSDAELRRFDQGRFGLAGMRERVEAVGGSFALHSRPGAGTRIVATIPYPALS